MNQAAGRFDLVSRTAPRRFSEDREPWRVFKSSLAIGFHSKARGSWQPEKLAPEVRASILSAIEARRSIAASNAFLHTGMRRFLRAANEQTLGQTTPPIWKQTPSDIRKLTREVVDQADLDSRDKTALAAMLSKVDAAMPRIELLAHGLIKVVEEKSWSIMMEFSLPRQRGNWTPDDVEAEALEFAPLAADALEMFDRVSEQLERAREELSAR